MLRGANVLLDPILGEVDARLAAAWMSDPAVLGDYFNVWPAARRLQWRGYFDYSRDSRPLR